jgi:anti-sigma factor RsiW
MKCNEYEERISLYVDDELDDIQAVELFHHLGGCSECRKAMLSMLNLRSGLVRAEGPMAPAELDERVLSRTIGREIFNELKAKSGAFVGRRFSMPAPAAVGVACLLVVIGIALSALLRPLDGIMEEQRGQTLFLTAAPAMEVRAYSMPPVTVK